VRLAENLLKEKRWSTAAGYCALAEQLGEGDALWRQRWRSDASWAAARCEWLFQSAEVLRAMGRQAPANRRQPYVPGASVNLAQTDLEAPGGRGVGVLAAANSRLMESRRCLEACEALLLKWPSSMPRPGSLHTCLAETCLKMGDFAAARRSCMRALELLRAGGGIAESYAGVFVLWILQNAAFEEQRWDEVYEAKRCAEQLVARVETSLRDGGAVWHPDELKTHRRLLRRMQHLGARAPPGRQCQTDGLQGDSRMSQAEADTDPPDEGRPPEGHEDPHWGGGSPSPRGCHYGERGPRVEAPAEEPPSASRSPSVDRSPPAPAPTVSGAGPLPSKELPERRPSHEVAVQTTEEEVRTAKCADDLLESAFDADYEATIGFFLARPSGRGSPTGAGSSSSGHSCASASPRARVVACAGGRRDGPVIDIGGAAGEDLCLEDCLDIATFLASVSGPAPAPAPAMPPPAEVSRCGATSESGPRRTVPGEEPLSPALGSAPVTPGSTARSTPCMSLSGSSVASTVQGPLAAEDTPASTPRASPRKPGSAARRSSAPPSSDRSGVWTRRRPPGMEEILGSVPGGAPLTPRSRARSALAMHQHRWRGQELLAALPGRSPSKPRSAVRPASARPLRGCSAAPTGHEPPAEELRAPPRGSSTSTLRSSPRWAPAQPGARSAAAAGQLPPATEELAASVPGSSLSTPRSTPRPASAQPVSGRSVAAAGQMPPAGEDSPSAPGRLVAATLSADAAAGEPKPEAGTWPVGPPAPPGRAPPSSRPPACRQRAVAAPTTARPVLESQATVPPSSPCVPRTCLRTALPEEVGAVCGDDGTRGPSQLNSICPGCGEYAPSITPRPPPGREPFQPDPGQRRPQTFSAPRPRPRVGTRPGSTPRSSSAVPGSKGSGQPAGEGESGAPSQGSVVWALRGLRARLAPPHLLYGIFD